MKSLHISISKKIFVCLLFLAFCAFPSLGLAASDTSHIGEVSEALAKELAQDEAIAKSIKAPVKGMVGVNMAQDIVNKFGERLLIIDVRTEAEYEQGHIPEAKNIPLNLFSRTLWDVPVDRPILLVCRSGARAERAMKILRGARPTQPHIWFFEGSIQYDPAGYYQFLDKAY